MRTLRLVAAAVAALSLSLAAPAQAVTYDAGGSLTSHGDWYHVGEYTDVARGPDTGVYYAAGNANTIQGSAAAGTMTFGYDVYSIPEIHVNRFTAAGAPDPTWYDAPDDYEGYTGDSFLAYAGGTLPYGIEMMQTGFSDGVPVVAGDGTDNGFSAFVTKWPAGGFHDNSIKEINPFPGCRSNVQDIAITKTLTPQIYVSGISYPAPAGECDITKRWIVRLNGSDLSLDTSFGNAGGANGNGYVFGDLDMPELQVLPTGRILAVGNYQELGAGTLMRFLNTGAPDPEFSGDGKVELGDAFAALRVTVADDGSYYVAGRTGQVPTVMHVTQNGVVDRDFGNDGAAHMAMCDHSRIAGITEQDDGKIVVGVSGQRTCEDAPNPVRAYAFRLHGDGTPDSTFGSAAGYVTYEDVIDLPGEEALNARTMNEMIAEPGTETSPAGRIATVGEASEDVGLQPVRGYLRRYDLGALASRNTQRPGIEGADYRHGTQLTSDPGLWAGGSSPDELAPLVQNSYQWLRCDAEGNGCAPIAVGATEATYTPTSDDAGHRLRVRVRQSSNAPALGSATSTATPVVKAVPPSVVHGPTIAGEKFVGGEIEFTGFAEFSGTEGAITQIWVVCATTAIDTCVEVPGSTDRSTHIVERSEIGKYVRLKSVSDNTHAPGGGTASAFSDPIGPLLAPDPVNRPLRWNPATDFLRAGEEPGNANPDAYGNSGIWNFQRRAAGVVNPAAHQPLSVFSVAGPFQHWTNVGDYPVVGLDSGWPGFLYMEPSAEQDAVLAFTSPLGGKLQLDMGIFPRTAGEAFRVTLYRGTQVVFTEDDEGGFGIEPPAFDVAPFETLYLVVGHVPEVAPHGVVVDLRMTTVTPAVFMQTMPSLVTDTTPTISGSASRVAGDGPVTVKVYSGSSATGTPVQSPAATVADDGDWTVVTAVLAPGHYAVQAVQSNASGESRTPVQTFEVAAPPGPPTLKTAPVIDPSGTVVDGAVDVVVGTKLGYGSVGTYNGNDVQLDDSGWIRCPTAAMDTGCTAIGTGEDTYTTVAADVGKYVSFRELVSNASGSLEAKAIPRRVKAAAVADPTPTPTAAPAPTATPAPTPAPPTIAEIIKRAMDKAKSALGTPTVVPISGVNLGDFGSVFGGTNKPAVNLLTGQFGYVYCQPKLVKNAKCEFVLEPVVEPITAEVPLARAAAKKKARKIKLKKVTISLEPDQGAVAKLKITKAQRKAIGKLKKRSIRLKLTVKRDGESKASAVRLPIKKK